MRIWRMNNGQLQSAPYIKAPEESYDLVIVGLGTSGSIALISAARLGLRVLGIDRHTCMGGAGTAGGVLGYYFGTRGGLFEQIDRQVATTEKNVYTPSRGLNAEGKQYILEMEALQAGAEICYDTTVTGVLMEDRTVQGVECFSPERGRFAVSAAIVIDSTGNADVCRLAGCELRGGRTFDGQAQPFSNALFFLDKDRVRAGYTDSGYCFPEIPETVSQAIVESALLSTHYKEKYEEENRFLRIAPQLGIREGQFIVGEDNVTLEQFMQDHYTREPVFVAYSNLDNHSKDVAFESDLFRDWTVAASLWGLKFTVPVPLGALIPKGYDGLLVAGRCLAVDHDMASLVRMKRDMQKCGEAAAQAANLAIKKQIPVKDVPYEELARMLREADCLSEKHEVFFQHRVAADNDSNPVIHWIQDPGELKAELSGDKPGVAIWSARRMGEPVREHLLEWMEQEEDAQLRKHSAIALALLNGMEAAPVLRDMVREKDPYVPRTSLKYNQARGYAAVYLLGKLEDKAAVPELLQLLHSREGFTYSDSNKEFLSDEQDLRFQYVSYAMVALSHIGDRHPDVRQTIREGFEQFLKQLDGSLVISFKGSSEIRNVMDDKLRQLAEQTFRRWRKPA